MVENSNLGVAANEDAANKVFSKMLLWQFIATLVTAVIALILGGIHAGLSATAGGMAVVIAAYIASRIAQRDIKVKAATSVLFNLLMAEAVKILVIIILLFLTYKFYKQLVPLALIAGIVVAAMLSGAAISKMNDNKTSLNNDKV
jgi:ATP synthase protein I